MKLKWLTLLGLAGVIAGMASTKNSVAPMMAVTESGRGRLSDHPAEMTPLGWKDILLRTYYEMDDDRLFSVAAGVAFYALLALVPALTALIALYGLMADPLTIQSQLAPFMGMIPSAARDLINEQAVRLAAEPTSQLSVKLIIAIAIALWGATAAIKALFDALNVIYDEVEKRSFLVLNATALFTTFSAIALVIGAVFLVAVVPAILPYMPFSNAFEQIIVLGRWPVFFALAVLAIAVLYRIGPSRRAARFKWVMPGAVVAALLWAIVSMGFSWYASSMGNYQATYGSLAAVIVFMTWLWLSASAILIGAELNSELEHQTLRDTTTGLPKPMGLRGARMADEVGPAVAKS